MPHIVIFAYAAFADILLLADATMMLMLLLIDIYFDIFF